MARRKVRFFRIIAWILAGIVSLVILATLVFYLGRNFFLNKAVSYLNEQQPGEVRMGRMNLIPFLKFPDISLQLREVKYFEKEVKGDSPGQEPIIALNEIGVTLDLVELIKGGIMVSEARFKDGIVFMQINEDSVSNLEHALGIRFGVETEKDTAEKETPLAIELDKIELINVRAIMDDRLKDQHVSLLVNRFESSFSYLSGQLNAGLEVDIDIDSVKYQVINGKIDKNVLLKGSIAMNPGMHTLEVQPSSLSVSGLEFETWGNLNFGEHPRIDFAYTAANEGLELLNYLFRGILDLREIEQIGDGSIHMNGTVQGGFGGDELPVIRVNGNAEDLGFRIRALNRDVTGISFHMFATNGRRSDLSDAYLELQDFVAYFPEGFINANITASNVKSPELNIEVDCAANLEGLEEMFQGDYLSMLSGTLSLQGQVSGTVNRETGSFLNDDGTLTAGFEEVSFVMNHGSIRRDSIRNLSGALAMHDSIIEAESVSWEFNGNQLNVGLTSENVLLYLLDYERDIRAGITLSSALLRPETLLGDTAVTNMLGEEIKDLYIEAKVQIGKDELDDYLAMDSLPVVKIFLDSSGVSLPLMAKISDVNVALTLSSDTIALHHLRATIGQSSMELSANLANYQALARADSGGMVSLDFNLSSGQLRAEDLFTIHDEFLLPETYSSEHLEDLYLTGSLEASAAGLVYDSVAMDFKLDIVNLGWGFRYYPSKFRDFLIRIEREGDTLLIENFQGSVGENNIGLSANIVNFADTLMENIHGNIELYSDLLDFNHLLAYGQPLEEGETEEKDTVEQMVPFRLNEIAYPNIDFGVDIGEIRYDKHKVSGINGRFRTSKEKIFYLDQLVSSPEGKGTLEVNGQLNLSDPDKYYISAEFVLEDIDIGDLNLELQSGDTILALNDHFNGIVDARGLAEIFITPELNVDVPNTTAAFNVRVRDGALINFTPLQAAGKFLDSKDLNNVRFATVRNSFTLMDSMIIIPLMNVESTLGQLLIQGEQGLDMAYLYLVHVPPKLAREAARSAISEGAKEDGEDQVNQMKRGDFLMITVWSDGTESDFKLGDKRQKFQK
ncbi:MAG: hypothetical protein P1P86_00820 [Bacteroidales bacterium]|nr:hypothetical protein [Bacteroidales bacterium]